MWKISKFIDRGLTHDKMNHTFINSYAYTHIKVIVMVKLVIETTATISHNSYFMINMFISINSELKITSIW